MNLSDKLRRIRESKGISQVAIGEKLQMDQSQYSRLERNGEKITVAQIKIIAVALEVSILELIFEKEELENEINRRLEDYMKESQLLKKELELTKRENEVLKRELQQKND